MFERFTTDARGVVVAARELAAARGDRWVGTEHMLLAVVEDDTAVARALASLGLTAERVRAGLEAPPPSDALRHLGIDLDAVRRRAEEVFGPGALDQPFEEAPRRRWRRGRSGACPTDSESSKGGTRPRFSTDGKKALELALREAIRLGSREITVEHVLLGVVRADGPATRLVSSLGVEPGDVRQAVLDLRRAA
jgi:ATP-dependent Clp protease ATP-binding subunit ClpA